MAKTGNRKECTYRLDSCNRSGAKIFGVDVNL